MLERLGLRRRAEPMDDTAAPVGGLVRAGERVELREHVPANKPAFQRWYADSEIATLLRHDLAPLSAAQSASYFDSLILPLSQRGLCFAIHERESARLLGTTALTDISRRTTGRGSALFRIVIGEKDAWGLGFGTEATRLVVAEAFERHALNEIRLEVFRHNPRAIAAYRRVGFAVTGEHVEWVGPSRRELNVMEMRLRRADWDASRAAEPAAETTPAGEYADIRGDATDDESEEDRTARQARRRALRRTRRERPEVVTTDASETNERPTSGGR